MINGLLDATESGRVIEKVAADKGYHATDTLVECQELDLLGVKTDIPEPAVRRRWTAETEAQKAAVLGNRARTQRAYGKGLQRKRSELVERSFAHICDTGGGRRSWLRGLTNVRKRHLIAAAAHNLGLILRSSKATRTTWPARSRKNSPLVITVLKEELRVLPEAHLPTTNTFERIQSPRREVDDSQDYKEGNQTFFEKRKPILTSEQYIARITPASQPHLGFSRQSPRSR
jgi:hypothetical protein